MDAILITLDDNNSGRSGGGLSLDDNNSGRSGGGLSLCLTPLQCTIAFVPESATRKVRLNIETSVCGDGAGGHPFQRAWLL